MSAQFDDEIIENFVSVTGETKERAIFFLEMANGDLETAIGQYFENNAGADMPSLETGPTTRSSAKVAASMINYNADDDEEDDDDDEEEEEVVKPKAQSKHAAAPAKQTKPSGSGSRVFTLNSLRDDEGRSGHDEGGDDDENEGQAFYAGGSETSGQQILGPSKSKKPEHIIKNLFQKAKEHGAQEVDSSETGKQRNEQPAVYGTGYRLGTGNEPTEVIKGAERPKKPQVRTLKLWKNGFNVDDGVLRLYTDPQNREFLQSIERGEPPRELLREAEGGEVHLDMQDHREEEFVPPKPKYVLFNDGYKLGSPTPTVVSSATNPDDKEANEKAAKEQLAVDESAPVTQIQVRLSNGTRLVAKANQSHKIDDLRKFINRARPEYQGRTYSLLTSFPNREITNESETLKEANLLNAVIIQKLKE